MATLVALPSWASVMTMVQTCRQNNYPHLKKKQKTKPAWARS